MNINQIRYVFSIILLLIAGLTTIVSAQTNISAQKPDLTGGWESFSADGKKFASVWRIVQSGTNLEISNASGESAVKSTGQINGNKITDSTKKTASVSTDGKELRWSDGAIWKKQNKARLLQVLYVIPKGQTRKSGANQVFAAIMKSIQRYYHEQLGVTFGLKTPLVTTVYINDDATTAEGWEYNAKLIKKTLPDDYVKNENVVFTVIEGSPGDAGGSWNIVKMTGDFWNEAYETYNENPANLPDKLPGWAHELGHAFGLEHTSDSKSCFAENKVNLGTLPSLLMQQSVVLGSLYNYPLHQQEKRLLLEADYLPDCRSLLSEPEENGAPPRPHSSLHLRYSSLSNAPKPPAPRYITFRNQSDFEAELKVEYQITLSDDDSPQPEQAETGSVSSEDSKTIEIPHDLSADLPIRISVHAVGTAQSKIFTTTIPSNFTGNKCFQAAGTEHDPQVRGC